MELFDGYDYGDDFLNSQDFDNVGVDYSDIGQMNYADQNPMYDDFISSSSVGQDNSWGNTLSGLFGKGGTVPQFMDNYGGAIKGGMGLLGGLYGLNKGNKAAGEMRGLGQQQQAFGQQQMANSQYWDQSARNAQRGLDPSTLAAMSQAKRASERQSNVRGINSIHSSIAAQEAMSGPQQAAVNNYGRLAGMYNQGADGAYSGAGAAYGLGNAASAGGRQAFGQGAGYITGPSGDNQLLAQLLKNLGRG